MNEVTQVKIRVLAVYLISQVISLLLVTIEEKIE